jgi:hypothetical protein
MYFFQDFELIDERGARGLPLAFELVGFPLLYLWVAILQAYVVPHLRIPCAVSLPVIKRNFAVGASAHNMVLFRR